MSAARDLVYQGFRTFPATLYDDIGLPLRLNKVPVVSIGGLDNFRDPVLGQNVDLDNKSPHVSREPANLEEEQ